MKWLLPEPNDPVKNAARLVSLAMAPATRPSAESKAADSESVTT